MEELRLGMIGDEAVDPPALARIVEVREADAEAGEMGDEIDQLAIEFELDHYGSEHDAGPPPRG